jgi:hypothetical protein
MASGDTHQRGSFGWPRRSRAEICSGDQHRRSSLATRRASTGFDSKRNDLGRRFSWFHRCWACPARYRPRPPLRATSRATVEHGRPIPAAMNRNDQPWARPRPISHRSSYDNRRPGIATTPEIGQHRCRNDRRNSQSRNVCSIPWHGWNAATNSTTSGVIRSPSQASGTATRTAERFDWPSLRIRYPG